MEWNEVEWNGVVHDVMKRDLLSGMDPLYGIILAAFYMERSGMNA